MQKIYPLILTVFLLGCQPERKSYPTHDVGYIDPQKALHPSPDFKICGLEKDILQYYNHNQPGDKPAGYTGGPKAIKKHIRTYYPELDLGRESGMFTVRFIINCEGKTGRFEIFENNLDYVPSPFNPKTREQLLKLTRELEDWRANYMDGDYRDSFVYITYRIENGKITEILP